jgi:probable phosphoglycerate mutase
MELILIRHGETLWNRENRVQGSKDIPLSPVGIKQAQAVAQALSDEEAEAIISSDLGRAKQTAEHISQITGVEISFNEGLRERAFGILEGMTKKEMEETHPEIYNGYSSHNIDFVIPEGESARQSYDRHVSAVLGIANEHQGKARVILVSHGGLIHNILRYSLSIPLEAKRKFNASNASINRFKMEGDNLHLTSWEETHHLRGI